MPASLGFLLVGAFLVAVPLLYRLHQERAQATLRLHDAYTDRNLLVQVAALMALHRGYRAGIGTTTDEDGWPIVYIDLPDAKGWPRQISYHVPQRELIVVLPDYTKPWDGHDTTTKRRRVRAWLLRSPSKPPAPQIRPTT